MPVAQLVCSSSMLKPCCWYIPPKANRRWKTSFSPFLYRDRNAIERMSYRLQDFSRVATRYNRLAINYLAAVCLVATVCYWASVWTPILPN